jgi:hypothetical protein
MTRSAVGGQHEAAQEPLHPCQDWTQIPSKTIVDVIHPSGYSHPAVVDEKSPDSTNVWVFSINGHGRKMYCNWDVVQLRPPGDRTTISDLR